jgi:hypothetical protein
MTAVAVFVAYRLSHTGHPSSYRRPVYSPRSRSSTFPTKYFCSDMFVHALAYIFQKIYSGDQYALCVCVCVCVSLPAHRTLPTLLFI